MTHSTHFPILEQLGLNESEALIYELLLEMGRKPAQDLVEPSALGRGNVYNILTSLKKKGLVTEIEGKKTVFEAAPPSKLATLLDRERSKIDQLSASFAGILPLLTSEYNLSTGKPTIQMFEGHDGIVAMYNQVLELTQKELLSIEDKGEMAAFIPDYFRTFIRQRVSKEIFNRVVAPSSNQINITSTKELRETRTISAEEFPFAMDIKIFETGLSLVTFQNEKAVGVLIQQPVMADNFRLLFEFFWKHSKQREETPAS